MTRVQYPPLPVEPVEIVYVLRTVERQTDKKTVLPEQVAPGSIEQHAVRLDAVADRLARAPISLLQMHQSFEEIDPGKRRLPSLEGESRRRKRVGEIAAHQPLQRSGTHRPRLAVLIRVGSAIEVEAVLAVEIADSRGGFDQEGRNPRHGAGNTRGHRAGIRGHRQHHHRRKLREGSRIPAKGGSHGHSSRKRPPFAGRDSDSK